MLKPPLGGVQVGRHLWEHHLPAGAKYPLRRAKHHSPSTPYVKPSKQRRVTSTPLFFDPEGYEPEEGLGRSDIPDPAGQANKPVLLGFQSDEYLNHEFIEGTRIKPAMKFSGEAAPRS